MPTFLTILMTLLLVTACEKGQDRKEESGAVQGGTSPLPADPGGKGVASTIQVADLSITSLYTQDTSAASCVPVKVKALAGTAGVADVSIVMTIVASGAITDLGTITPAAGVTNAQGEYTASYCSGKAEGAVTIQIKSGNLSANSSKITITKKPTFEFAYVRSDLDKVGISTTEGEKVITMNTLDSGPSDCTVLYFKLLKSTVPVAGQVITFATQVDFPKGSKLGKRADALKTEIDAKTGKKYAIYAATSSGAGELPVPVCAGVTLGTMMVYASFTDTEEGRTYNVQSPVIRITAGLTNYTNFSLTYDADNARALRAFYNTNSEFDLNVAIQLGARFDGRALPDYPVTFASEVGRYTLANGGVADADTGTVKAKLHALHLVDNYPYPVLDFGSAYSAAQTRCEPTTIAAWALAKGVATVPYTLLRQNWRSTGVYAVRGQEYFNDANRDGIYQAGGDGFWDKNQNGVYDAGDELYDINNNGVFDANGEWFIDLPTPFVDVDEDRTFDAAKDYLLGDEYSAPNKKRDSDAFIWKSEVFPISMGPSSYGLMSKEIVAGATLALPAITNSYLGTTYGVFGRTSLINATFWPGHTSNDTTRLGSSFKDLSVFAKDLCGNILPGGTKIDINFVATHAGTWNARDPLIHIYVQPSDNLLEPTRHLLKSATGASSAVINFNATDHPSNTESYPVAIQLEVPACEKACTGIVSDANPGVACDGYSGRMDLTVSDPKLDQHTGTTTISNFLSYTAVNSCNCAQSPPMVIQDRGACRCADPAATWTGSACVAN